MHDIFLACSLVITQLLRLCSSQRIALDQNNNYVPNYGNNDPQNYVTVPTGYGVVQGQRYDLGSDKNKLYTGSADVFLGIPYAQSPTGENRFRAPRQANSYNTIYDATYYRPKCPQANEANTNEDCLYLNVFTQQSGNSSLAMAVLIMIDGGNGLNTGGQDSSTTKGIVSNLVKRGIVVVTLQYRIGALGFFTTYTDVVQPNLGMLDQVQALRWVNTEIRNFGGDPNRVTLCGQGDGACAVSAQTLSPMSQNLFQQAIIQSGSINSCYNPVPMVPLQNNNAQVLQRDPGLPYVPLNQGGSYQPQNQPNYQQQQGQMPNYQAPPSTGYYQDVPQGQPQQNSYQPQEYADVNQAMAQALCNVSTAQWQSGNTGNIRNCLQQYTVDVFARQFGMRNVTWMIVRDNSFFPDTPENLAKKRPKIPVIIGTVQDEDADYAFKLINTGSANQNPNDMLNGWIVDYAKKNKLNSTVQNQIGNIVSQNYNIPYSGCTNCGQQQYNPQIQPQYNPQYQPTLPQYQYGNANYGPTNQPNYQQPQINYQPQYDPTQVQQPSPNSPYFGMNPSNTNYSGVSNLQTLKEITQVATDSTVSLTTTEVDSFIQNGNQHVRVYAFTHVSQLGRQYVPNTGTWQPVFKGQDMYFVTMSETVWSNGNYSPDDQRMADQMGQQWANFVQSGQVTNWQPVNSKNYNYCNLNQQPQMQNNYAPQARQVFQRDVNPVVQQVRVFVCKQI
ncbi:hypothetical protein WR25_20314 isoform G [Diploscapter pachys]|uniref:Carboxylesterase type B domain-containing protein n=1 Tax=Diploscapter pachys TaxID=2018661 RepID=A0A2A2LPA6_9BILA|nr:hypothetical protein WR25_20314 isoform G [Diploscapter pachys]